MPRWTIVSGRRGETEAGDRTLEGNTDATLGVYLELLDRGPSTMEDLMITLHQRTKSEIAYQLGKLAGAGYVMRGADGRYLASDEVARAVLTGYSKIGSTVAPQLGFFAVLFSVLIGFFALESLASPTYIPFLVAAALGSAASTWYMTLKLWRKTVPAHHEIKRPIESSRSAT